MITIAWAYLGEENESVGTEEIAKTKVLARFPGAVFQDWTPCEESEAKEDEEVMWILAGGEPKLALYQND